MWPGQAVTGVHVGSDRGALARLPDDVAASLRRAYAGELAVRLPLLRALRDDPRPDLEEARRAAHALASSAAVLGEADGSRAARELEDLLVSGASAADLRAPARDVVALLERWQA